MIEFVLNTNNNTIDKINFTYDKIHINGIKVKYIQIKDYHDEMNIGSILEKFRKFNETNITCQKYNHITNVINESEIYIKGFMPSHIITLKSHHKQITNLINTLNYNILTKSNIYPEDVSDCFLKNSEKSITEYERATDDFLEEYNLNERLLKNKHLKSLLIVDDVIKKGRLINQLLIRLARNGNIESKTKIFIYTIYSFKII